MSTKQSVTPIRALKNFDSLSDGDVVARATAVIKGMTGNLAYPGPPVDLTALAAAVSTFSAAIAAALVGGKNAKDARNKARKAVIKELRLLAAYVENACNDDPTTFSSSGFAAASTVRTPSGPPAIPTLRQLLFGNSGQFLAYIDAVAGGRAYNLRYAPLAGVTSGTWVVVQTAKVRKPVTISGLTPGTTYAFQVQALGSEGLSDWSDSVTSMCI